MKASSTTPSGIFSGVYTPGYFSPDVFVAFSGREFDTARRSSFLKRISLAADELVLVKQVHGNRVVRVTEGDRPSPNFEADALITNCLGIALGVVTADCLPIFFWSPETHAIGIAHAGWRGVEQGILKQTIEAMRQAFSSEPSSIQVAMGACIRLCCYEVGDEFQKRFPSFYQPGTPKGHLDLVAAAKAQLLEEGVAAEHLQDSRLCTACPNSGFFSYRREKTEERMLSVVVKQP